MLIARNVDRNKNYASRSVPANGCLDYPMCGATVCRIRHSLYPNRALNCDVRGRTTVDVPVYCFTNVGRLKL